MVILGIDYGRKKIGVAISNGKLAEPLKVIRYKNVSFAVRELEKIINREKVGKVVIGISEGEMAKEARNFGLNISNRGLIIDYFDETLSTQDAQRLSISAGVRRCKRKRMEDAYAASVMLQNYLD